MRSLSPVAVHEGKYHHPNFPHFLFIFFPSATSSAKLTLEARELGGTDEAGLGSVRKDF
jgi:hypothetical protein